MKSGSRLFLLPLVVLLGLPVGCNSLSGSGAADKGATAEADRGRIVAMEARMIGLTEELDRFARRLAALESSLGHAPSRREPVSPPARVPDATPEPEPVPEPTPGPKAPPDTTEPGKPDPVDDWPVPEKSGPRTSVLIDARGIPEGALPGTSQARFRIVDAEGVTIFTSADVDPQVLRTRPIFWTAKAGTTLGPASLPVLGGKPLRIEATDGALREDEPPPEAVIYVSAKSAAALRGLTLLGELVRAGNVAILLRPDE